MPPISRHRDRFLSQVQPPKRSGVSPCDIGWKANWWGRSDSIRPSPDFTRGFCLELRPQRKNEDTVAQFHVECNRVNTSKGAYVWQVIERAARFPWRKTRHSRTPRAAIVTPYHLATTKSGHRGGKLSSFQFPDRILGVGCSRPSVTGVAVPHVTVSQNPSRFGPRLTQHAGLVVIVVRIGHHRAGVDVIGRVALVVVVHGEHSNRFTLERQ